MFQGWHSVLLYWLALICIHYTIIPITKICINNCKKKVWIPLYIIHQSLLLVLGMHVSQTKKLGFASVMIIMAEATRMLMKSHSYFRTKMLYLTDNQYKDFDIKGYSATNIKHISDKIDNKKIDSQRPKSTYIEIDNNDIFTEVKNLSYFFFVPTIIYRDRYTLTPIRSMGSIIAHALNFLACIYYCNFLSYFQLLCCMRLYVNRPQRNLGQNLTFQHSC